MAVDSYEFTLGGGEPPRFRAAPVAADLLPSLPTRKMDISILEIGCGTSRDGEWLHGLGYKNVVSLDIVSDDFPKNKAPRGHNFLQGDAYTLPFKNDAFYAVIISYVLQDIIPRKIEQVIREAKRVTIPGGLNAVRAYIGRDEDRFSRPDYTILRPGALELMYAGWRISPVKRSLQQPPTPTSPITSYEQVITRRPSQERPFVRSVRTPLGKVITIDSLQR